MALASCLTAWAVAATRLSGSVLARGSCCWYSWLCGGVFIYALFSREKNGAKFCQGARNGAGCGGVKGCGVVQLGAARNCAVCAVLLQIYLHCLRFKCARLIAFKAGFTPAFLWALFGEVVGDVDDLAADLDVVML